MLATMLAAFAVSLPAAAQPNQQDDSQSQRDRQRDRQMQADQRQRQQDQRDRARQPRDLRQRRQQMALQPQGWVRIAVDYDQDNRFDAMETIYYYDLVQARERSAQRRGQQGRQRQMARSDQTRQRQQLRRASGRVTDMTSIRLNDGQEHRLAKIETQQGQRIPVDLGRAEQADRLDLQEGDRISVWGTRARINDRRILRARRVQAGDQQVTINRERDRNLKRVRGRIANLRTTRFRGRDQQFRVARLELNGGRTETVILGPQDRLQSLNLQQGDEVRLLVRPGRLNDQQALVAEQIRANERTVRVQQPGRRTGARQQGSRR